MIIDTSALIAILRDEPEAAACARAIEAAPRRRISAANFVEVAILIDGSPDPLASRRFDDLVREAQLVIEPVTRRRRGSRAKPIGISAGAAGILRGLISGIVSPTLSREPRASRCCSRAPISHTPTSRRRWVNSSTPIGLEESSLNS